MRILALHELGSLTPPAQGGGGEELDRDSLSDVAEGGPPEAIKLGRRLSKRAQAGQDGGGGLMREIDEVGKRGQRMWEGVGKTEDGGDGGRGTTAEGRGRERGEEEESSQK